MMAITGKRGLDTIFQFDINPLLNSKHVVSFLSYTLFIFTPQHHNTTYTAIPLKIPRLTRFPEHDFFGMHIVYKTLRNMILSWDGNFLYNIFSFYIILA